MDAGASQMAIGRRGRPNLARNEKNQHFDLFHKKSQTYLVPNCSRLFHKKSQTRCQLQHLSKPSLRLLMEQARTIRDNPPTHLPNLQKSSSADPFLDQKRHGRQIRQIPPTGPNLSKMANLVDMAFSTFETFMRLSYGTAQRGPPDPN